jgi:3-dehydroquinate dehydratase
VILFLQSCHSIPFLDVSGKGAKAKCLKLSTDNLTIACNCIDKQIVTMTIFYKKSSKEIFGDKTSDIVFNPTINSYVLPIIKDSAEKCFLQIEIHLTNSHHRETYYIETKPGDFSKTQNIYSRYFSH